MRKFLLIIQIIICNSCSLKNEIINGVYITSKPNNRLITIRDSNFLYISIWGNNAILGRGSYKQERNSIYLNFETPIRSKLKSVSPYTEGLLNDETFKLKIRDLGEKYDSIPENEKMKFQEAFDFVKSDSVYDSAYKW